ncbi:MAG: hypothetical protein QM756_34325, partial [Polyangiaceae bacterium]
MVSIEWLDPLMLGGTCGCPELIELAAGTAVGARAAEPAPTPATELRGAVRILSCFPWNWKYMLSQ